jgi:hypothetical protein
LPGEPDGAPWPLDDCWNGYRNEKPQVADWAKAIDERQGRAGGEMAEN